MEEYGDYFLTSARWQPTSITLEFDVRLRNDTETWTGSTWSVECHDASESSIDMGYSVSGPFVTDSHYRLSRCLGGNGVTISFCQPVRNPHAALGEIMELHWKMMADKPLETYFRPEMLHKEYGV